MLVSLGIFFLDRGTLKKPVKSQMKLIEKLLMLLTFQREL